MDQQFTHKDMQGGVKHVGVRGVGRKRGRQGGRKVVVVGSCDEEAVDFIPLSADDEHSLRCVKDFFKVPLFFTEPIRDSLLHYSSSSGSEKTTVDVV